jgi:hypothetical protein
VAGMYVAESRDLLMSGGPGSSDRMIQGEVYHRLYQAISRAACREVWVDEQGRTQAKPTKAWLMSRHKKVRQELGRVFPGALWIDWAPASGGKTYETKVTRAAREIRELLDQLGEGVTRIASKSLKAKGSQELRVLARDTFQRARDKAIQNTPWSLQGQSLVYSTSTMAEQDG